MALGEAGEQNVSVVDRCCLHMARYKKGMTFEKNEFIFK